VVKAVAPAVARAAEATGVARRVGGTINVDGGQVMD
jgi:hypothetical protein